MPGGNEPSQKKRKRPDRREKEKPLLAVQGLLRLDHCFVKPSNDDAEVIEVEKDGQKSHIVLAPSEQGKSEHDMVAYKAGYDTGPSNPLPQDEREEVIFAQKKIYDDAEEYFEEMKRETEENRKEREAQWKEKELSEKEKAEKAEARRIKREARKRKKQEEEKEGEEDGMPELDPKAYGYAHDGDPDNPNNYLMPEEVKVRPENFSVVWVFAKHPAK